MLHKTAILIFTFILACAYAQTPETYTVKRGDTLFRISKKYGMSVGELQRLNNLRSTNIVVGQKLAINSSSSSNQRISSRGLEVGEDVAEGPRTYYKVRRGDNIYSIASEFGVLVDEIREWNSISQVRYGQTIIVGKNDVARVPAFGMTPKEDRYEDADIYRKRGPSTTLVRKSSQDRNDSYRTSRENSYRRANDSNSRSSRSRISEFRDRDSRDNNNNNRRYSRDSYEDDYNNDRKNSYRRYEDNDKNYSSRQSSSSYDDRYENDRFEDSYNNKRYSEDRNNRYKEDRYEDEYDNSRMPRAADIKYGSRVAAIYEPYEEVSSGRRVAKDYEEERAPSYTDSYNNRNRSKGRITGDFTELKSNKAGRNRFYAFHDSLPLGSRIKMEIPNNSGFIEVEVIDRLPTYERVMIGLSPACVAVLEGAGASLDEVTIIAE